MNIVRKLKISNITNTLFTDEERKMLELMNEIISIVILYKQNGILYYMNANDSWVFDIDTKYKKININMDRVIFPFNIFKTDIYVNDVTDLFMYVLKKKKKTKFNCKSYEIILHNFNYRDNIVNAYKLKFMTK